MSTLELRKRLIDKIKNTDNEKLLAEAYRLLELDTQDLEVYKLSPEQRSAINEARAQVKEGQFLTNEESDQKIDEWLKE
jgi:hypothetical protein